MPHKENMPQHARCAGQCGKVEHFSSRNKLFEHLRAYHGVSGFQRRGRGSRQHRQEARANKRTAEGAVQPRPARGPNRQWIRVSTADANESPAKGVSSPVKAPSSTRAEGPVALNMDPLSRANAAHAPPVDRSSRATVGTTELPTAPGWALPALPTAIAQSATAPGNALRWREPQRQPQASANSLPSRSCLVSPGIGADSSEKAPCSLERAPFSPAEAPTAAGEPPRQNKRQQPLGRIPGAKKCRYR